GLAGIRRTDRARRRRRAAGQRHLLLERLELGVDAGPGLERLELALERGIRRRTELGGRLGLGLERRHALVHAREGAVVGVGAVELRQRLVDRRLGLGPLLARDQDVALALGLFDLAVEP